jgi:hypothetical protein
MIRLFYNFSAVIELEKRKRKTKNLKAKFGSKRPKFGAKIQSKICKNFFAAPIDDFASLLTIVQ